MGDNYKELYLFMRSNGVAMDEIFQWVADQLDILFSPPRSSGNSVGTSEIGSIKELWDELITKIIPYDKFLVWLFEQSSNPDFIRLVEQLVASEAVKDRLNSSPEYQSYRCWMIREGIDLVSFETSACHFLEWKDCSTGDCQSYPGWVPVQPTTTTPTKTATTPPDNTTTLTAITKIN